MRFKTGVIFFFFMVFFTQMSFAQKRTVMGKVSNKSGKPMFGVSILVEGTIKGVSTDIYGKYKIDVQAGAKLIFSYVGFQTQEITISGGVLNVILQETKEKLKEIVVTGIVKRNKETYTGATRTITRKELLSVGNGTQNILQNLQTLDPSISIIENNSLGSDPNKPTNIKLRGSTSIDALRGHGSNPNQPLFVLDGFEVSLRTISDLTMNRVKSITILKDAASTALYGARAANGVIVIETIRPKGGKLRVNYTGDFGVSFPDFSDFNLMNAEEKLRYEKLAGSWESIDAERQRTLDGQYNSLLADIQRGTNTYWLKYPVQVGFVQSHTLYVQGGDGDLVTGVGLNYKNKNGVMKGSGRGTYGGWFDLNYRKNGVTIYNKFYISGYKSADSPYGDFSKFTRANPYFKPVDKNGKITETVVTPSGLTYENPLYSSTLLSRNTTNGTQIQNNINIKVNLHKGMSVSAGLQLAKATGFNDNFVSPKSYIYRGTTDPLLKGLYHYRSSKSFSYDANVQFAYYKIFKQKHSITANIRGQISENKNTSYGFTAVGFPEGVDNLGFDFGLKKKATPSYSESVFRRVGLIGSVNYNYKRKYLLDLNTRIDGSTAFGSNRRYNPFYSVGIGWNLHREFNLGKSVQLLRITANWGVVGEQSFGGLLSANVYTFDSKHNIFGKGLSLSGMGNPDLEWQRTVNKSINLNASLFNDRLGINVSYYIKNSNPLVILASLPDSKGVSEIPVNKGSLSTEGVDFDVRYAIIDKPKERINWSLSVAGQAYKSRYDNFGNSLSSENNSLQGQADLKRYKDGYSPSDLWAVRSLGIDPSSGKELFLKKNGIRSFIYDYDDEVVLGNSVPKISGILGTNFRYKNFNLNINIRYELGAYKFNTALWNKVENISAVQRIDNQDKRALYNRWKKPGDISVFRGIREVSHVNISSRFVQKENLLSGESINLSYSVYNKPWLRELGLNSLRLGINTNNIFRLSTIKAERGTSYPFAHSASFSLNASF